MFRFILLALLLLPFIIGVNSANAQTPEICPEGYTCPDTTPYEVEGEKLPVVKESVLDLSTLKLSVPSFSGETGPNKDQLLFPQLEEEHKYYDTDEFYRRSLPVEFLKRGYPRFEAREEDPTLLEGTLAHPGCGNLIKNGQDMGPTKNKSNTTVTPDINYAETFLRITWWQSIFVPDQSSTLKFKLLKPEPAQIPENYPDCDNRNGVPLGDTITLNNPAPFQFPDILGGILGFLGSLFSGPTKIEFALQQDKFLPAEKELQENSVGKEEGLLNFFKPGEVAFTRQGDQDEIVKYKVVGDDKDNVGVNYDKVAELQSGTVDLIKSLYPKELAVTITDLESYNNLTESGDVVTSDPNQNNGLLGIPYRDAGVTGCGAKKSNIISRVKSSWPNSKIDIYWDTVFLDSRLNGINPCFALALWIEESGAGHFPSHFSCPPSETDFHKSFRCFINTTLSINPPNFEKWAENYCGKPAPGQPVCGKNEAGHDNSNFLKALNDWYNILTS